MSSGPENRFIRSIHRLLDPQVYRMKNHNAYMGGVTDCWYSGNGGTLWVEYKFLTLPRKSSAIVDLCGGKAPVVSVLQQEWLRGRHEEGRAVGVIIGTPDGGVWLPGVSWEKPRTSTYFKSATLQKEQLAEIIASAVTRSL